MSTNYTSLTSGSSSGLDVTATVEQLLYVERAPERMMQKQQALIDSQKSALQDLQSKLNSLEDVVAQLRDFSGPLNTRSATSSDASVFSASADQTAIAGTHTITVERLATVSSVYTDSVATDAVIKGDLVLTIGTAGPVTISFNASHATVATAAEYINSLQLGVTAQVITDTTGIRMALVSNTSGAAGDLVVESAPPGLGFNTGNRGEDAKILVDGIPVFSATNRVSGLIAGVTLDLISAEPARQLKLSVAADTGRAKQAIRNLVASYNSIIKAVNGQFAYDVNTKSAGVLAGDASVRGLQSSLLSAMSFQSAPQSKIRTLKSLGVDMQDDGTLKVNDSALDGAFAHGADAVVAFFQGDAADGFANAFGQELTRLTDSVDGPLNVDMMGLDNTRKSLSDSIDDLEARLQMREQILTAQYTRINTLLQQFTLSQQQLAAMFGNNK